MFHSPVRLRRIFLRFTEYERSRTQEFSLRWSATQGPVRHEIVRQQWNFSPTGSTEEIEDYHVDVEKVAVLELAIHPGLGETTVATVAQWRLA